MSDTRSFLPSVKDCLATLDHRRRTLMHYKGQISHEFSLRGKIMDMVLKRENSLPRLIREAADVYSECRELVAEKAVEFEERQQELFEYLMKKLTDLEGYSSKGASSLPDIASLKDRLGSSNLAERAQARRSLLEAKITSTDSMYGEALHVDRVKDTEVKIADAEYILDVVNMLTNAFKYANDKISRQEEHLRAISESVCSVIGLNPFSRKVKDMSSQVRRTMQLGYQSFEECLDKIKYTIENVQLPRLSHPTQQTRYLKP